MDDVNLEHSNQRAHQILAADGSWRKSAQPQALVGQPHFVL
jgi:hypothetical protein